MAKHMFIDAEDSEFLQAVGKALSSKERIEILKLLYYKSLNINEISEALSLPASSTSVHIRILEEADLIYTENQPGIRGTMKLCSRKKDDVFIKLTGEASTTSKVESISMPIGNFTDCQVAPTCGMAGKDDYIIYEDNPTLFFVPNRTEAQLIWTSRGFFEYRFPKPDTKILLKVSQLLQRCVLKHQTIEKIGNRIYVYGLMVWNVAPGDALEILVIAEEDLHPIGGKQVILNMAF